MVYMHPYLVKACMYCSCFCAWLYQGTCLIWHLLWEEKKHHIHLLLVLEVLLARFHTWRGRSHPILPDHNKQPPPNPQSPEKQCQHSGSYLSPLLFLAWLSPVAFSLSSSDQHVDGSHIGHSLGPCNVGNNRKGQRWRFSLIHQMCAYDESFYSLSKGWSSCLCLLEFPLHNRNVFPYKLHLLVLSKTSFKIQWNVHQIG